METMIKNQREYLITKSQVAKLATALSDGPKGKTKGTLHPLLRKAQTDALRSQLADLKAELKQFEALQSGKRSKLSLSSIDDLPRILIQGRIASGLTQKDLAERLGLKEQQIQRYEATNYASASLSRVCEVAHMLGLNVKAEATVAP